MASRQEEKERRREERLVAERAAAASAARGRRLRLAIGGVLAAALVAAIAIAVVAGGSSSKGPKTSSSSSPGAKLPAVKTADLSAAAKAAGCTLQDFPGSTEDRGHTQAKVKYKTNPPAFGPHNPVAAADGDYVGQGPPQLEMSVHALEHGRIEIQYRPDLPSTQVKQLEALFNESAGPYSPGQYLLLFPNATNMPYAVAATAWTHILGCKTFNPGVFDAIRAFRLKYTLKAPEFINQAE